MKMRHAVKHLNSDEGSGLVLALMVLMVLSVLGASLGAITIGSHQLSDVNRDSSSSYYIAESGASLAYEEMKITVQEAYTVSTTDSGFFSQINNHSKLIAENVSKETFESQFGDTPSVSVEIKETGSEGKSKSFTITSTGSISGKQRTVEKEMTVNWVDKSSGGGAPRIPNNASLLTKNNIEYKDGSIIGDIYLESTKPRSFLISNSGSVAANRSVIYNNSNDVKLLFRTSGDNPPVQSFINRTKPYSEEIVWNDFEEIVNNFPSYDTLSALPESEFFKDTIEMTQNYSYDNFTTSGNKVINTLGKDVNLVVNTLGTSWGSLEIAGSGSLNIFVKDNISFGGGSQINSKNTTDKLNIYYSGRNKVNIGQNGTYTNASFFVKNADIELFGSPPVTGVILSGGSNIYMQNGTNADMLIIAPFAKVEIAGGGRLRGSIVSKEIDMSNGGYIEYKEYNFDNFPFSFGNTGGSGSSTPATIEDLMTAEPIVEIK